MRKRPRAGHPRSTGRAPQRRWLRGTGTGSPLAPMKLSSINYGRVRTRRAGHAPVPGRRGLGRPASHPGDRPDWVSAAGAATTHAAKRLGQQRQGDGESGVRHRPEKIAATAKVKNDARIAQTTLPCPSSVSAAGHAARAASRPPRQRCSGLPPGPAPTCRAPVPLGNAEHQDEERAPPPPSSWAPNGDEVRWGRGHYPVDCAPVR